MDEFIRNIAALRAADGSISLSWVWPTGYECVRVVFLHKLSGRSPDELTAEELSEASDLCFMDEFQIAGGRYIYPVGAGDAGLLRFRVYCCSSPESTDFTKSSAPVQITGIPLRVKWKASEKKSGKTYKKLTFSVTADAGIPSGSLAYKAGSSVFPIDRRIPAGESVIGPVVLGAGDNAVLCLAPGHEDEYEISAG